MSGAAYNSFTAAARGSAAGLAAQLNARPLLANANALPTFTLEQSEVFTGLRTVAGQANYTLLWHEPNTSSGFSATVFRNTTSGEVTLAVRGTEFNASLFNLYSDLLKADILGIGLLGVAKAQLADAYRLYKRLITPEAQAVTYTADQLAALRQLGASYVEVLPEQDGDRLVPPDDFGLGVLADNLAPLNLTGHSLGGHVALMLGEMVARLSGGGEIGQVATFNAPGVGGPQVLQELNDWLGFTNATAATIAPKVVNVFAEKGMSFTAGLGGYVGTALPAYIESDAFPISNHSMMRLVDSLAIYDAFGRLAPALGDEDALKVLEAVSVQEALSQESALDALRATILGTGSAATPTIRDDRDSIYRNLYSLLDSTAYRTLAGSTSLRVLIGADAASLADQAKTDFGHFLAVHRLLPFALEGASSVLIEAHPDLYARWNADRAKRIAATGDLEFTDAYLADRAQMLSFLAQGNSNDTAAFPSSQVNDQVLYRDLGSLRAAANDEVGPTEVNVFMAGGTSLPHGPNTRVISFGTDVEDTIKGRENNDRLYGGAGPDMLIGAGGNDRLEGGSGADTLNGGTGLDTYFADWGDIIIDKVEPTRGGSILVGSTQLELGDGFRTEGERFFTAANGVKYWERSDGAISAFGPDGAAALLIAPPGTTVPGAGAESSTIISGRPDLGIRLVTERRDSLNRSVGGMNGSILALWDRARTWRPFADPLALDLDGDGFETLGNASGEMVLFDHAATGVRNGTGWLTGGDAWVVLDRDGDGLVTSGEELFGIDTPMPGGGKGADGFAAMAPLDTNMDGSVDAADAPLDAWQVAQDLDDDGLALPTELGGASFAELKLWRDENLNGFSEPFELQRLSDAGIVRINVDAAPDVRTLAGGNRLLFSSAFERADGSTGTAGALDLVRETFHRDYLTPPSATPEGNALPNITASGQVRDLQEAAAETPGLLAALQAAVAAADRESQIAAVSTLVQEWASSSSMQTGTQAAAARSDQAILYYQFNDLSLDLPWSAANGSIELPATMDANWFADLQSAEYRERLRRIEVLERFTGQTFADVSRMSAAAVFTANGHALRTIPVGIGADNWRLLEQAYAALEESTYLSIAVQSRLEPYVSAALRGTSGVGFGEVEALFIARHDADAIGAIGDLVDLARAAGAELIERGWVGLPVMLDAWLREARADPGLASQLGSLGVAFRDWHSLDGTGQGDILLGSDWVPPSGSGVRLADGGIGNDLIFGGEAGETTVSDGPGRDLIMGGTEINRYKGGAGHDIYLFGRGSGRDYLQPDSASGTTLPLDRDVLQFLPGVLPEDVIVRRATNPFAQFDAIEFRIQGTEDVFTELGFAHQDTTENDRRLLDEVRFADGTVWSAAAIRQRLLEGDDSSEGVTTVMPGLRGFNDRDDVISGNGGDDGLVGLGGNDTLLGGDGADTLEGGHGNDVLDGGPGDDALYGGFGVDAYVLARGGGTDQILNGNFITWAGTDDFPDLDVVRVAEGIGQDEVLLQRQASRLRILLADGSAQLLDTGNPLNPHYQPGDGHAPSVGRIEFDDGSIWDAQAIRERSLLGATGGPDTIVGFHGVNDTLRGLAGNDTLAGLGGDDVLEGGPGVDRLEGGPGADTYVWRRGDGSDDIFDDASDDMVSTLRLPEVALQDLYWNADARELTIGGESLRLLNPHHLWRVVGDDGDAAALSAIPAPPVAGPPPDPGPGPGPGPGPSPGGPPPMSTSPSDGNDFLVGTAGPDLLAGGRGNDVLLGGEGSDTYYFARGDGADAIVESPRDSGAPDRIRFGPGIAFGDLTPQVRQSPTGAAYAIQVGVGADAVMFTGGIEALEFDGGATVPIGQLFPELSAGQAPDVPPQGAPEPEPVPSGSAAADKPAGPEDETAAAATDPVLATAWRSSKSPSQGETQRIEETSSIEVPRAVSHEVGIPLDPLYREMTQRFDVLLQVGRANLSERYSEAVREFEERRRQREAPAEPPPPTEEEIMAHNRAMHAWHDRHPGFADVDGVEQDGVWTAGWGSGGERTFEELVNAGNAPNLLNPNSLPRLGGAARSPGISEGIRDLR